MSGAVSTSLIRMGIANPDVNLHTRLFHRRKSDEPGKIALFLSLHQIPLREIRHV